MASANWPIVWDTYATVRLHPILVQTLCFIYLILRSFFRSVWALLALGWIPVLYLLLGGGSKTDTKVFSRSDSMFYFLRIYSFARLNEILRVEHLQPSKLVYDNHLPPVLTRPKPVSFAKKIQETKKLTTPTKTSVIQIPDEPEKIIINPPNEKVEVQNVPKEDIDSSFSEKINENEILKPEEILNIQIVDKDVENPTKIELKIPESEPQTVESGKISIDSENLAVASEQEKTLISDSEPPVEPEAQKLPLVNSISEENSSPVSENEPEINQKIEPEIAAQIDPIIKVPARVTKKIKK